MKNCGIKVDLYGLLVSLLAHLAKTISVSHISDGQDWAEKFSVQESAFWPQRLSWEAPWRRLIHNSHCEHCLHPALKKVKICSPFLLLMLCFLNQLQACGDKAYLLRRALTLPAPWYPVWCPHHLLGMPEHPWMQPCQTHQHPQQMKWHPIKNVYWAPTVLRVQKQATANCHSKESSG